MKIRPDQIPIFQPVKSVEFIDGEWVLKTDGGADALATNQAGSYLVLSADGAITRRTLDAEGFIIHELTIRKGTVK